ncbi:MAG: hypothetical protein CR972_00670 [Candidatus Moraniibacteriota bacterium]|nr:MAG: hypothetical protein CR972_00670 [Candidatus Moranbacteria bacterium]
MKSLKYYFTSQNPNEKILHIVHRHWFNMFIQYIPILALLGIMIISFIMHPYIFHSFAHEGARVLFFFLQTFFFLFIWIYGFVIWFDYYLDIWIITTHRIVNVEQKGLFSRQVSELKFHQIQDVSTDVKGFFPTILNFGDITVQTAAEQSRFLFRSVGSPYKIKSEIMTLQKKHATELYAQKSQTTTK